MTGALHGSGLPAAVALGGLVALGDVDAGACVDGVCLVPAVGTVAPSSTAGLGPAPVDPPPVGLAPTAADGAARE